MSFAVIWQFVSPTSNDNYPQALIGHPGTFSESAEEAVEEGRRIKADDQIEIELRDALTPLAVVEVTEEIGEDVQERCEEVEIGDELLFYDLDNYARWQNQSWWPKP
jgi:hypothetical protein